MSNNQSQQKQQEIKIPEVPINEVMALYQIGPIALAQIALRVGPVFYYVRPDVGDPEKIMRKNYIIVDHNLMGQIARLYGKGVYHLASQLMGIQYLTNGETHNNTLNSDKHLKDKRPITQGFLKRLNYLADIVTSQSRSMVQKWQFGQPIPIQELVSDYILTTQSQFFLGKKEGAKVFLDGINEIMDTFSAGLRGEEHVPNMKLILGTRNLIVKMIAEYRASNRVIIDQKKEEEEAKSILRLLLMAEKLGWTDKKIADEIFTTVFGGYHTAKSTLVNLFVELLQNPQVYQQLAKAARETRGWEMQARLDHIKELWDKLFRKVNGSYQMLDFEVQEGHTLQIPGYSTVIVPGDRITLSILGGEFYKQLRPNEEGETQPTHVVGDYDGDPLWHGLGMCTGEPLVDYLIPGTALVVMDELDEANVELVLEGGVPEKIYAATIELAAEAYMKMIQKSAV